MLKFGAKIISRQAIPNKIQTYVLEKVNGTVKRKNSQQTITLTLRNLPDSSLFASLEYGFQNEKKYDTPVSS